MNEAMQKLVDAVQKASPVVWDAAYRQAKIDAWENIFAIAVLAVLIYGCYRIGKYFLRDDDKDSGGAVVAASIIGVILTIILFICAVIAARIESQNSPAVWDCA